MKISLLAFLIVTTSAFAQMSKDFGTHLRADLYIGGTQCSGEFRQAGCRVGQWLITVDDINVCNEDGICTRVYVTPFVAELVRAPVITSATIELYDIVPISLISATTTQLLKLYRVQFDLNAEPSVVVKE